MTTFNTLNNTPPSDQISAPIRGPSLTTPNTTTANLNKPPLTLSTPSQHDSNHPHTTTPGTTRPMSSALLRAQAILAQAASKSGANSGANSPTPHHPPSHSPYLKPSHPSVPDAYLDVPRNLLPPSSAAPSTKPHSGTSVLHHTTPINSSPNIPHLPPNPPHTDINQHRHIMVPNGSIPVTYQTPAARATSFAAISINGSPITPSPIPSPVPLTTTDGYTIGQTSVPSLLPTGMIEGSRLYNTMGHATLSLTQPLETPRSSTKVLLTANSIFDVPTPPSLSPADLPATYTAPIVSTQEVKSKEYTNEQSIGSNSFIPPPPPPPSLATASTASTAFASSSSTVVESITAPPAHLPPVPPPSVPSVPVSNSTNNSHNYTPLPPPHVNAVPAQPLVQVPALSSSQQPYPSAPTHAHISATASVPPPPPPLPSLLPMHNTGNTISSIINTLPIPSAASAPISVKQYEPPQSYISASPVPPAPSSIPAMPVLVVPPPPPTLPHTVPQPYTQAYNQASVPIATTAAAADVNKTVPSIPPPPPHAFTPHNQAPTVTPVSTATISSGYHSGPTTIQFAPQSIPPPTLPPSSAAAPVLAHLAPSPAPSPAPSAKTSIRPPPVTGSVAFYSLPTPGGSSKVQAPAQSAPPVSSNGGYNSYPATQQTQPQQYGMPPPPISNATGYQSGPPPPMSQYTSGPSSLQPPPMPQYPSGPSSLQPPPMSQYPSGPSSLQPPPMPQYQAQPTPPTNFSSIPANRSSTNLNTVLSRQSSDDLGGVTPGGGTRVRKPRIDPSQMPRPPNLDTDVIYYTLQPNTRKVPPLSNTGYKAIDTGNCSPRYIRATTAVPAVSASLQNTCGIPLGIIMTPFASPENGEEPVPIVNYDGGFIRCIRCKGYLNPFVTWEKDGNIWVCNLCQTSNETPAW